jgi:6-pyruvoyl-tetrahydropterin synthase
MKFVEVVHIGPICYAHQLYLPYESKCNDCHGHNAEVEVTITADALDPNGMVVDFTEIKRVVNLFDHSTIGVIRDITGAAVVFKKHYPEINPSTAENIALAIFELLTGVVVKLNPQAKVVRVAFSETPSSKVLVEA